MLVIQCSKLGIENEHSKQESVYKDTRKENGTDPGGRIQAAGEPGPRLQVNQDPDCR